MQEKLPAFLGGLVSFTLISLLPASVSAQELSSKDGEELGPREEVIKGCMAAFEEDDPPWSEEELDVRALCSCLSDSLLPRLSKEELEALGEEDSNYIKQVFLEDPENLGSMLDCFDQSGSGDSLELAGDSTTAGSGSFLVDICVDEIMKDPMGEAAWTRSAAEDYCDCAMNGFKERDLGLEEMQRADDPDSKAFKEVVLPCVEKVQDRLRVGNVNDSLANSYDPQDISGGGDSCRIPLEESLNRTYRIDVSFGGIDKELIFDTGASDLVIDQQTERELLAEGLIDPSEELGEKLFSLANNEFIKARMVRIERMRIGDYELRNVIAAVFDKGDPLCGLGFFDKFRDWEWDRKEEVLILYK